MNNPSGVESHTITVNVERAKSLNLHYLEQGEGSPILLLHGWPTSSHLWRNVMPNMAKTNRVIALDLPGFGRSDKPLDVNYSFRFFSSVISAFLDKLDIQQTGVVVHDLGGPVGIKWVIDNPQRVSGLGILNTLVYPELSWAVKMFIASTFLPGIKQFITSQLGIESAMIFGTKSKKEWLDEEMSPYLIPFELKDARKALLKSAQGLHPKEFSYIQKNLKLIKAPMRLIYGENDRILPDIGKTMGRLQADFPAAELTKLKGCGHFLQEDKPEEIGELLGDFFRGLPQDNET